MYLPMQMLPGVNEDQIETADSLLRANVEEKARTFAGMTWDERFQMILNDLWSVGVKIIVVIGIFIVGRWLIRRIVKLIDNIFEKRHVDPSLRTFTRSLASIFLYIVLFYLMIAWLGVNTSLFVALFAAAGLAIGMAMSGVFQNFAGGVMILLLKPFRVGDWIELQGQSGSVIDIRLFNTMLRTADNKTILLPNGGVSTSIVNNYNVAQTRRMECTVSLSVGTDFSAVRKVLMDIVQADSRILADPAPSVVINKLNTSTVDFVVYAWVDSGDYLSVLQTMNAAIYTTLPAKGFPFPSSVLQVNLTK